MSTKITVITKVLSSVDKVWVCWTEAEHIVHWNFAADSWHCPSASNDLRVGGAFNYKMAAKDGSFSFEFIGEYTEIEDQKYIGYTMGDGRKAEIAFITDGKTTEIVETFEAETQNSVELQKAGWQSIINNFKRHCESHRNYSHYSVEIDAPVDIVFTRMIDKDYYEKWTKAFNETSTFRGTWQEGEKILFVGCDKDGNEGGMVSLINQMITNSYISICHLGEYRDGKEILEGENISSWKGMLENYAFEQTESGCNVLISLETMDGFKEYFDSTWPNALQILKEICETQS